MKRTWALLALVLAVSSAMAVTNTSLLSPVKCDFAAFGRGAAMAVQADGKVLIGGSFDFINGRPRENLARLTRDGVLDESWLAEVDDTVETIVLDGDYVYVAGEFSFVNGTNYNGVVRLHATDGSIDETWNADVYVDVYVDDAVYAVAIDDTHVYLGGDFSSVGGEGLDNLARVDKVTGAVDATWAPQANRSVYAIQVSSGNVYVGGDFYKIGTNSASRLACINKVTGAMDTNWLGSTYGSVNDLVIDGNMLYVAGMCEDLTLAVQTNFALVRRNLATGIADTNWNPRVVGEVKGLAVEDALVYAVGDFTRVGSALKRNIVRINKASGVGDIAWCPGSANYASDVVVAGSDVYVAGALMKIGTDVVSGIARLNTLTGSAVNDFKAYCETRADILTSVRQADGKMIVGGRFFRAGDSLRNNLARICADGSVDPLWKPDPDLYVMDVAEDGTNIYVGGYFSVIGGRTRIGVARLNMVDGSADLDWESPLGGLPMYGNVSTAGSEAMESSSKAEKGISLFNVVKSIAIDETGVYIGGEFFTGGSYFNFGLAKLSKANGSVIPEFDAYLRDGGIDMLALDGNSLYVAGDFETIGGEQRNSLARLNATDGTADPNWDAAVDCGVITVKINENYVYVAGDFADIGGLSNTLGLARLSKIDASADPAWLPFVTVTSAPSIVMRRPKGTPSISVWDMAFTESNVVLAGDFQGIGNATNVWHLGRVSKINGACDIGWMPDPNSECSRLIADDAALYAFGFFTTMAGESRIGFAKLYLDVPHAPDVFTASKGAFTDMISVFWNEAPGAEVYQLWRGDSDDIESASLIAGAITLTNYCDTSVRIGQAYYYWLRGTNGLGNGEFAGSDFGWRRSRAAMCGEIGDYDGDRKSDIAIFDQARALWYAYSLAEPGGILAWELPWGSPGYITVVGDYNGDYESDWCAYHPATVAWYVKASTDEVLAWEKQWGSIGIVPVPGDYDGDGISDFAAYVKDGGYWYIWSLANGVITWANPWGWNLATPVPGDYDGDGTSDMAVYDSQGGNWYAWSLTHGVITWATAWGGGGLTAVPGDFNADGNSDLAVYDSEQGKWYVHSLANGGSTLAWGYQWGMPGTIAVPGDFDGDGANDWAVYDTSTGMWYIRQSSDGRVLAWELQFGFSGVMPVTAAGR